MSDKKSVTVYLEYNGHFHTSTSEDYKITKIVGAVVVPVGPFYPEAAEESPKRLARVGDWLSEKQAMDLSEGVNVITVQKV